MNALVYFAADSASGGNELWAAEADDTVSFTSEIGGADNAGVDDAYSNGLEPQQIIAFGDEVLFVGLDKSGEGLWTSNGSPGGTFEIGGLGSQHVQDAYSTFYARDLVSFGDQALFLAPNAADISDYWVTNGMAIGTTEIGGPENAGVAGERASGWYPSNFEAVGDRLFFNAYDTGGYQGLWVTDGTATGTYEIGGLDSVGVANAGTKSFYLFGEAALGDELIFSALDAQGSAGVWVSDGTATGTVEISAGPFPETAKFAVAGNTAYYLEADSTNASTLWVTDGTATGTYEVGGSQNDGVNGVIDGLDPTLIATFGSRAAFAGYDPGGTKSSTALWISDGTAFGTYQVGGALNAGVNGAVAADGLNPRAFGSLGARALFTGKDQSGKWGLWVTDGTAAGTTEIGGLNNAGVAGAYAGGLDPTSFVVEGDEAYFVAENANDQKVVFVSDGSLAGTYELGGSAAPTSASLLTATSLGSNLYTGGGLDVDLSNSANNTAYLENTGSDLDSVEGTAGAVSLFSAEAVIAGEGDTIDFQGGSGNVARLRNVKVADTVYGSNGSVYVLGGAAIVSGGDDAIYLASSIGNGVTLENTDGVFDSVHRGSGTVELVDAQALLAGGGFTVDATGVDDEARLRGTSGVGDTVSGSDAMVYLVGSQATIAGADDKIFMLQSSDVTTNAAHEFFTISDQPGDETINGLTSTDRLRFSTAEFADYQALSPDIAQVGDDAVITYDANQTVTLSNFQAANLTSTQFKFF